MNEDFFKIQLKIVDKHFPYTCKRSDEAKVRKAATGFTERFMAYSSHYAKASFSSEDLLKLAGFDFALKLEEGTRMEDLSPFVNKIEQLGREVQNCIELYG